MSGDWREKLRRGDGIKLYKQGTSQDAKNTVYRSTVEDMTRSLTGSMGTIESYEHLKYSLELRKKVIPSIDFSDPSNFCKFGSAEKYYEDSIRRIYNTYPFDGSESEKVLWELSSSYIDTYIFSFEYPRTTGYINLKPAGWGEVRGTSGLYGTPASSEYIYFSGGPNQDPDGNYKSGKPNLFDESKNRISNLSIASDPGNTVEFWLKKPALVSSAKTSREVVFDCHTPNHNENSDSHFRFIIELDTTSAGTSWLVTFKSSSAGISSAVVGSSAKILSSTWNHHAFSISHSGTTLTVNYYNNGQLNDTVATNLGQVFEDVTVGLAASIGCLSTSNNSSGGLGYGQLSGSLDDFRFWKKARGPREIGLNYISSVDGGTNEFDANIDLGVYYKFNEGIVGDSTYDSTVLDYSGRISNGKFHGYTSESRNTASAIEEYSGNEILEFKDPIIYEDHPLVKALLEEKREVGQSYDYVNTSAIINTIPNWIVEEQENQFQASSTLLKDLTQTLAVYFDTLYFQIEEVSKLRHVKYNDYLDESKRSGSKPYPFMDRVLSSFSFNTIDIFSDFTLEEKLQSRTEVSIFNKRMSEVKDFIFRNIYNNLTYIYKTKGTEHSFRNLIRCFGIDDELIYLSAYADKYKYKLENYYVYTNLKAKGINFKSPAAYAASIYQNTGSFSDCLDYMPGISTSGQPLTYEVNFTLPKNISSRLLPGHGNHVQESSIFGVKTPQNLNTGDMTINASGGASLKLVAKKKYDSDENKDFYFSLESDLDTIPEITSPVMQKGYRDEAWNVAVILRPSSGYFADTMSGGTDTYDLVMRGYSYDTDELEDSFEVKTSISKATAESFLAANKRHYVGAEKQNFTGSMIRPSDINLESFRVYTSELLKEDQVHHARNFNIFGHDNPTEDVNLMISTATGVEVPKYRSLVLHWSFDNVTGSSNNGAFDVYDMTSKASGYGYLENVIGNEYPGVGVGFSPSSNMFVSGIHRSIAKPQLPESVHSSDMVRADARDEEGHEIFQKDTRPLTRHYSFEKSMYRSISEEMMNFLASVVSLNDLIGNPIDKYRAEYKDLNKVRQHFFQFVKDDLDLEKFTHYYRWIDTAISEMIDQLKPATTDFSEDVRNMIESHVLERNKYEHKFPTIEMETEIPEARLRGINELLYNYKFGHAPTAVGNSGGEPIYKQDWESETVDAVPSGWTTSESNETAANGPVVKSNTTGTNKILALVGNADPDSEVVGEPPDSNLWNRWAKLTQTFQGPIKVKFNYIQGAPYSWITAYKYGVTDPPESGDNLWLQYSTDSGTTWEDALEITPGPAGWNRLIRAQFFKSVEVNIPVNEDAQVTLRWLSTSANTGLSTNYDHWGIGNIEISQLTWDNQNCLWWKDRAERDEPSTNNVAYRISSSISEVNTNREFLKKVINSDISGSSYAIRKFSLPYRFSVTKSKNLFVGHNFLNANKLVSLLGTSMEYGSTFEAYLSSSSQPSNKLCEDQEGTQPSIKNRFTGRAHIKNTSSDFLNVDADMMFPFGIYNTDSDHTTGYMFYSGLAALGLDITNLHRDSNSVDGEVPLQGPYSFTHYGGYRHRHVAIGELTGSSFPPVGENYERPENFRIEIEDEAIKLKPQRTKIDKITVSSNTLTNGQTFTLIDDVGTSVTFVFDTSVGHVDAAKSGSNYKVGLQGADTIAKKATAIANSINGVDTSFSISATSSNGDVTLTSGLTSMSAFDSVTNVSIATQGVFQRSIFSRTGGIKRHYGIRNIKNKVNPGGTIVGYGSTVAAGTWQANQGSSSNLLDISVTTTNGQGRGAVFKYYTNGSGAPYISLYGSSGGSRYQVGEIITFTDPGNTANTATVTVTSVNIVEDRRLGNYQYDYDVVMVAGSQNRSLVEFDLEKNNVELSGDQHVAKGVIDFALLNRTRAEHIIASRFHRPGGSPSRLNYHYDSHGGGEYSLYDTLTYSDSKMKGMLNKLHSELAAQFGCRSGSIPKPNSDYDLTSSLPTSIDDSLKPAVGMSIHGTNRNTRYEPNFNSSTVAAGNWSTSEVPIANFNNYFVQTPIPSSDLQYKWIHQSTLDTTGSFFGYESALTLPKGSNSSIHNTLTFPSSSDFGLAINEVYADKMYLFKVNPSSELVEWYTLGALRSHVENKDYNYDTSNSSLKSSLSEYTPFNAFSFIPLDRAGTNQVMYLDLEMVDPGPRPMADSAITNTVTPRFNSLRQKKTRIKSVTTAGSGDTSYTSSVTHYDAEPYSVIDETLKGAEFSSLVSVLYDSSNGAANDWTSGMVNTLPAGYSIHADLTGDAIPGAQGPRLVANSSDSNDVILAMRGPNISLAQAELQGLQGLPPTVMNSIYYRVLQLDIDLPKVSRLSFKLYAGANGVGLSDPYGLDAPDNFRHLQSNDLLYLQAYNSSSDTWTILATYDNFDLAYTGRFTNVVVDIDVFQNSSYPSKVRWVSLSNYQTVTFGQLDYDHWALKDVKLETLSQQSLGYYDSIGPHLNSYILNKVGAYGWNTWNQLRAGTYNKVVGHLNKNNLVSLERLEPTGDGNYRSVTTNFKEPAVMISNNRVIARADLYQQDIVDLLEDNNYRNFTNLQRGANDWVLHRTSRRRPLALRVPQNTFNVLGYTTKQEREFSVLIHKGDGAIHSFPAGLVEPGFGGDEIDVKHGIAELLWKSDYQKKVTPEYIRRYYHFRSTDGNNKGELERALLLMHGSMPSENANIIPLYENHFVNDDLISYLESQESVEYNIDSNRKAAIERSRVNRFYESYLKPGSLYIRIESDILPREQNKGFSKIRKREDFICNFWKENREDRISSAPSVQYTLLRDDADTEFFSTNGSFIEKSITRDFDSNNSMGISSVDYNFQLKSNKEASVSNPYKPWDTNATYVAKEFLKINQSTWPLDGRRNLKFSEQTDVSGLAPYPISSVFADYYVWSFKQVENPLYVNYITEHYSSARNPGEKGQDYVYRQELDPNGSPKLSDPYVVSFLGLPFISHTAMFPEPFLKHNSSKEKMYYFKYVDTFAEESSSKLGGSSARFVLQNPLFSVSQGSTINSLVEWVIPSSSLDTRGQRGEGELQNDYSIYHMGASDLHVTPPPAMVYSRRVPQTIYAHPNGAVATHGAASIAGSGPWEADQGSVGNYLSITPTSTTGAGAGAAFIYLTNNSGLPSILVSGLNGGSNYQVGDTITFTDPGSTSNTAAIVVSTITQNLLSTGDITGMRGFQVLSGDAKWEASEQLTSLANNPIDGAPFYKSYEEFRSNFKGLEQKSTIIPEFKISDLVPDLYGGVYEDTSAMVQALKTSPYSSLTLTGSSVGENIEKLYTTAELSASFGISIEPFDADNPNAVLNNRDPAAEGLWPMAPARMTLRSRAILKLLPYDGFYPVLRTTQIGSIFANDYLSPGYTLPAENDNAQMNALMKLKISSSLSPAIKPFFAPGVLYNSIKSGLAVDYPIFTNTGTGSLEAYNAARDYGSGARLHNTASLTSSYGLSPIDNESDFRKLGTSGSSGSPWNTVKTDGSRYGLAITGAYFNGTEDSYIPRIKPATTTLESFYRVPFEALYRPEVLNSTAVYSGDTLQDETTPLRLYDNEPHPSASYCLSGYNHWKIMDYPYKFNSIDAEQIEEKWGARGASKVQSEFKSYKLAINNFLAETVNTFLGESQLSCIRSKPSFEWDLAAGNKYGMVVKLRNRQTRMYDRYSAFGPPVDSTDNTPWPNANPTISVDKPGTSEQIVLSGSVSSIHTHMVLQGSTSSTGNVNTELATNYPLVSYNLVLRMADTDFTYVFSSDNDAGHYTTVTNSEGDTITVYKDLSSNSSAGTLDTANNTPSRVIGFTGSTTLRDVFRDLQFKIGQAIATKQEWFTGAAGNKAGFEDSGRILIPIATDSHEFLTANTQAKLVTNFIKRVSDSQILTDVTMTSTANGSNTWRWLTTRGPTYTSLQLEYELVTGISAVTGADSISNFGANQTNIVFPSSESTDITSSGAGHYAFFKYSTNGSGAVTSMTIIDGGRNYQVGDTVTVTDSASGNSATLTVSSIGGNHAPLIITTRSNSTSTLVDVPYTFASSRTLIDGSAFTVGPSSLRISVGLETAVSATSSGRLSLKHFFDEVASQINSNAYLSQDLVASISSTGRDFENGNLEVSYTSERYLTIRKKQVGVKPHKVMKFEETYSGYLHKLIGPIEESDRVSATRLSLSGGSAAATVSMTTRNQQGFAFNPYTPPFLAPDNNNDQFAPTMLVTLDYSSVAADVPLETLRDPSFMRSKMSVANVPVQRMSGYPANVSRQGTAYNHSMTLSASLDHFITVPYAGGQFDQVRDLSTLDKIWVIAPKWETPVLDFTGVNQTVQEIIKTQDGTNPLPLDGAGMYKLREVKVTSPVYDGSRPDRLYLTSSRGMWHQYSANNLPYELSLSHYAGPANDPHLDLSSVFRINQPENNEELSPVTTTVGKAKGADANQGALDKKEIAEAVVAMPLRYNENTNSYEPIPFTRVETLNDERDSRKVSMTSRDFLELVDDIVVENDAAPSTLSYEVIQSLDLDVGIQSQIELMDEFIIPPNYDFLRYPDIVQDTVVMFIMPFYHTLDKDDVINWWQNLPPRIAKEPKVSESYSTHSMWPQDILRGNAPGVEFANQGQDKIVGLSLFENIFMNQEQHNGNIDTIKWKVFKVKKRAKQSYDKIKISSYYGEDYDESRFSDIFAASSLGNAAANENSFDRLLQENSKVTWNWPYDFFSLVELVSVESKCDLKPASDLGLGQDSVAKKSKDWPLSERFVKVLKKIHGGRY